ncbi:MAG: hypothetical protein IJX76_04125 [Clostridia bacterium]|nr:hypothetical protein [Clostridia bacterium]
MFKKKKKTEVVEEVATPEAEPEKPGKKFPALPIGDSAAAGLIAVIFAAVGVLLCVKTCKAANPKEKKPKKPKKENKAKSMTAPEVSEK